MRAPDEYFLGSRRFVDARSGQMIVNVHAGDCFVTSEPNEVAATVLGSCIAACVRDPIAAVGGMNHFLLPISSSRDGGSARFGAFAMEQLINEILKRGGRRERLEVKLFGGGHVIKSSAAIGDQNASFALEYLQREGIAVMSHDVGGHWPRNVRYTPVAGRALVRRLRRDDDFTNVIEEEKGYQSQLVSAAQHGDDVELF